MKGYRKLLMLFLIIISTILVSCVEKQDFGLITGFYIKDETIHWDDIEEALYYEVFYYYEESQDEILFENEFCFESHTTSYNHYTYHSAFIEIEVIYEDGTSEISDMIEIACETPEFGPVIQIYQDYFEPNEVSWLSSGRVADDFISYTVELGDKKFDTSEQSLLLTDFFTEDELSNNIYEMTVTVNYQDGSSRKSYTCYIASLEFNYSRTIEVDYAADSGEDLTFEFDEGDVIIFNTRNLLGAGVAAPEGIFTCKGDEITVSSVFLNTPIGLSFMIYTENHFYAIDINKV